MRASVLTLKIITWVSPSVAGIMPVSIANGATPASMLPQEGAVSTIGLPISTCANR